MTVTVKKVGGSVAVIIPKAMAADMELAEGTPLELSSTGGTITMRRKRQPSRRPRRPMSKIAAQIKPASYRRRNRELGQDRPVGGEAW